MRPREMMCPQDVEPQVIVGRRRRTGSIFNTPTPTPTPSPSPNAVKMAAYHAGGVSPNQRPAESASGQFSTLSPPQSIVALAFQFPDSPPTTDESTDPSSPLSRARDVSASTTTWPVHDLRRTDASALMNNTGDGCALWNGGTPWLNGGQHQQFAAGLPNGPLVHESVGPPRLELAVGEAVVLLQPTTIYVTGFPSTASERECGHVFRAIAGFQSLQLVRKKSRYCDGSRAGPRLATEHVIVFATFDSWFHAHMAICYLRHYVVDPNLDPAGAPLRASFANNRSKSVCCSYA